MMTSLSFRKWPRSFAVIKALRCRNYILTRVENLTVMESAWSMLHAFSLHTHLWAEVFNCAMYILNRTMNKQLGSVTHEKWFAHKPSVSHY